MLVFSCLIFQGFELPQLSFSFVKQVLALRFYSENEHVKSFLAEEKLEVYTVCRGLLEPKGVVFASVKLG